MSDKKGDTLYEGGIGWGIMLFIFMVLFWLFWRYNADEVRNIVRWIRYSEMWIISWFIGPDYKFTYGGRAYNWHDTFDLIKQIPKQSLRYEHLAVISAMAIKPLKLLYLALCAIGAYWCLFRAPGTHYRSKLDLEGLIRRQAQNFSVIAPFIKFNPSQQPPRPPGSPVPAELPLFAEALGPEEWLAYNSIPAPDGKIDEAAAAAAFEKQLGERWAGPQSLKPYQQILLAAFMLKAARKRSEADDMLGRLALCWSERGLRLGRDRSLLREARRILRDKNIAEKTLKQVNRHAYVTTALLRALHFARNEGGVLAPAQFLWLRGHDRALWYPLNNLGRQSFHTEALGAMAHFKAERMTQRPIPVPKVTDAVQTLKEHMTSRQARPIPPLDYSQSRKKGIKMAR